MVSAKRGVLLLLLRPIRRFGLDRAAVAGVEFALILPIMLMLYFGTVEFGNALTIARKATHLTSTLADLVTQSKTVSNTDIANIFEVGRAIMEPYATSHLRARVNLIYIDEDGEATVTWSDVSNYGSAGTVTEPALSALASGTPVVVPDNVLQPDSYVIQSEVHYYYTPMIGYLLTGIFDLNDEFFLSPRLSDDIKRPPNYT
jgi:Flp pilus assembly protein TadG